MALRSWLKWRRTEEKPLPMAASVAELAARGEAIEALLHRSAISLLESSGADRAGVWVETESNEPCWLGQVVDRGATELPSLQRVNGSESFPVNFAEALALVEFRAPDFPIGPRSFFEGMNTAISMPLRVHEKRLGAALVSSKARSRAVCREAFRSTAAEIAVSLFAERARRESAALVDLTELRRQVDEAIISGEVPTDTLQLIAAAAARATKAEFAGIAHIAEDALRWEVLAGSKALAISCQSAAVDVVNATLTTGETVVREPRSGAGEELSLAGAPLANEAAVGVLVAGYRGAQHVPLGTLQDFRMLAAWVQRARQTRGLEAKLRALFERSGEAFAITDPWGTVVEMSRRARELLGWKGTPDSKHVLGRCFRRPEAPEFQAWLSRVANGDLVGPLDCELETGFRVRLSARKVEEESKQLLVTLEEGSLAERADRQWKRLQAELLSVLDGVRCGVLLVDAGGNIRFANAHFGMLFGLDVRALEGLKDFQELRNLIEPRFEDPKAFPTPWHVFANGSGDAIHDELEVAGAPPRILERYARPVLDEDGGKLGWLEIYRDITNQRNIQSKLEQTDKMAALGQLVSGIAHELNNPLTSIMGYAQLLLARAAAETPGSEAKMIFDEAERARRIVKNLLFFARQAEPERSRVDINEIIERTVSLRGYELKIENITVTCELAPDLPPTLADPFQLQQVVLNLLVNAEQAILESRGYGRIRVRTRKSSEDRLTIEVFDNGPGIPSEVAARIFDPFFTTKPPGVGTGLGLSIVYGIVEQHAGQVTFDNLRGGGARFTVNLPVTAVPDAEPPATALSRSGAPRKTASGRVLVVEDEPTVAQLVADVLRGEGHNVDTVLDSPDGLAKIARNYYNLIICDLRMPRLDGPAFYDALVSGGNSAQHRILFITGDTLGPHTAEFLKSHQLPYLAKPFLVEELKLAVNRVLGEAANGAQIAPEGAEAHA
jgi:signal transduction histidine kinase/ActR/RegA family two-component response regulator